MSGHWLFDGNRNLNFVPICACGCCLKRVPVNFFGFGPNLCPRQLFKEGNHQALMNNFALIFPSNSYNLGLVWTIWTFSMLNIFVLSFAIWWAPNLFDFCPFFALGSCSKRGGFEGGLLFVHFTLACCQPNVVINPFYTYEPQPFTLSLDTTPS